jgi:hypothetical protein
MWEALIYYIILTCEALMGVFGARFYEEPRYEVLARIDHRIEIRRYAPRLAAQIELPQADRRGRDEAFRTLFAYIAGANSASGSVNARIRHDRACCLRATNANSYDGSGSNLGNGWWHSHAILLASKIRPPHRAEATGPTGDTCPTSKCHSCYPAFLRVRL